MNGHKFSLPHESTLVCVAPTSVDGIWPMVAPMIEAAYAELDEITPDVRTWLIEEKGLLWIAVNVHGEILAAMTSSLIRMRSGLACRMVACGGGALNAWKYHATVIEDYARAEGCYKLICDGRLGWARVLEGYEPKSVTLEKRV